MDQQGIIKAIIFDMDGTLINSTEIEYQAWRNTFEDYGVALPYNCYIEDLGTKSIELVKMYLKHVPESEWDKAVRNKQEYIKEIINKQGIYFLPYAEQFLNQVKQFPLKMALATSSRREKVDFIFKKLKLSTYFDTVITGDDVKNGKPDPEIFLKAAGQLHLSPQEVIVIEDAANGVKAAKNGNMKCMAITSSVAQEKLQKADFIFDSYQDLDLGQVLVKLSA